MKIKELLSETEQLDEIPRALGGTGVSIPGVYHSDMPGTTDDTRRAGFVNWMKKKTGMGTGGKLLQQANKMAKVMYNQWLSIVPTLQQTGRISANDPVSYINNLVLYVQRRLNLNDEKAIADFRETVGEMPNKATIVKAFEQAYQNAILSKQIKQEKTRKEKPSSSSSSSNAIPDRATVEYAGKKYTFQNGSWWHGSEKLQGNDVPAANQQWADENS